MKNYSSQLLCCLIGVIIGLSSYHLSSLPERRTERTWYERELQQIRSAFPANSFMEVHTQLAEARLQVSGLQAQLKAVRITSDKPQREVVVVDSSLIYPTLPPHRLR